MNGNTTQSDGSTASKPTEPDYDRDEQGRASWERYGQMIQICYNDCLIRDSIESNTDTGEFEAVYDTSEIDGELEFSELPDADNLLNDVPPEDVVDVDVSWRMIERVDSDRVRFRFKFEFEYYNYDRPRLGGDSPDAA
jgi:hypothetical protein